MIKKVTTDTYAMKDTYRVEKKYFNKTYSAEYNLDMWTEDGLTPYSDLYKTMAAEWSRQLDVQALESIYRETGWVKLGCVRDYPGAAKWISQNVRCGYSVLADGSYWFQDKDEAAWFRMQWAQ